MCGITGIIDLRGRRTFDEALVHRMNESQHHRGPDECGVHLAPGVALGHKRLAIIAVTTGQQPLYNEDGTVVVVYNGEIYNYQALIVELTALGHRFRTHSDTEVIVHAWEAWGAACVQRFRGMFAFALWDEKQETLLLARDRLGVKPLHYAYLPDGTLVFGSELKSLEAHPGLPRTLDGCAVEEYFAFGYIPDPRTIYAGAHKLPPGHTLCVRRGAGAATPAEYWDPRFTLDDRSSAPALEEELRRRLDESVRLRMISEVPLGAFLSGGVDSSAVVASMAGWSEDPVVTCSMAFDDPAFDESRYAQEVALRYRTQHFVERVESDDFDLIDRLAHQAVQIGRLAVHLGGGEEVAKILEDLLDPGDIRREALLELADLLEVGLARVQEMVELVDVSLEGKDAIADHVAALGAQFTPGDHPLRADDPLHIAQILQAARDLLRDCHQDALVGLRKSIVQIRVITLTPQDPDRSDGPVTEYDRHR